MNTEDYIQEIKTTLELKDSTAKTYRLALNLYSKFHKMSIEELLEEAEIEEEENIRLKHRTIKKRILSFRQELLEIYRKGTADLYLSKIKAFYRFYEIELPKIPAIKNVQNIEEINQVPTINHVKQAVNNTSLFKMKAIILFMFTSGCASNEVIHLTVQDFMDATSEYHEETEIIDFINSLQNKSYVIPTFHIIREKTHIPYYTFCTPETTQMILEYMKREHIKKPLTKNENLFRYNSHSLTMGFIRVNDQNKWGYVDSHRFFHSHALRKLFATTLTRARVDPLTIHFLMGHKIDNVTGAYFKVDPEVQKQKYMDVMDYFGVNEVTRYETIKSSEKEELNRLRKENFDFEKRLKEMEHSLQSH